MPGNISGLADIFLHDLQTGVTQKVTAGLGGAQTNGNNFSPAVSSDGRFIAFQSSALVAHDTNGLSDVFFHDRLTGGTRKISTSSVHAQGNGDSLQPHLSAGGRFVVFESDATNLVDDVTDGERDIFVSGIPGPPQARR